MSIYTAHARAESCPAHTHWVSFLLIRMWISFSSSCPRSWRWQRLSGLNESCASQLIPSQYHWSCPSELDSTCTPAAAHSSVAILFLPFLSARFLAASLCERCLFLPTHRSSWAAVTRSGLAPVLLAFCWMKSLKQCLPILLNPGPGDQTNHINYRRTSTYFCGYISWTHKMGLQAADL